MTELPDLGCAIACEQPTCPGPQFTLGFGLAGGGYGAYEYCDVCDKVVSKTQDLSSE